MKATLAIARLTIHEASRRKLLLALLGLTALVIGLTTFGLSRLPYVGGDGPGGRLSLAEVRTVTSQLLILIMFMFSFVLAISAVFVASPSISGDVESGVALAMLTRPISRNQVVLGKWLGLSVLIGGYALVASGTEILLVNAVTGYMPPNPVVFAAYLLGDVLALLTLALLVSTRLSGMTGGVLALGAFGVAWLGGIAAGVGEVFENATITNIGYATKLLLPTDGLWRGAVYSLEPAAFITLFHAAGRAGRAASANPFFSPAPPNNAYVAWSVGWLVGVIALAMWSFRRREI